MENSRIKREERKRDTNLKVTSGTRHLTPLWKGLVREMVWLT